MTSRETLLKRLQVCDFNLAETALYLDTHPTDKEALEYYKKYLQMQKETTETYVANYGPIMHSQAAGETKWEWIENPWPWENSEV